MESETQSPFQPVSLRDTILAWRFPKSPVDAFKAVHAPCYRYVLIFAINRTTGQYNWRIR